MDFTISIKDLGHPLKEGVTAGLIHERSDFDDTRELYQWQVWQRGVMHHSSEPIDGFENCKQAAKDFIFSLGWVEDIYLTINLKATYKGEREMSSLVDEYRRELDHESGKVYK